MEDQKRKMEIHEEDVDFKMEIVNDQRVTVDIEYVDILKKDANILEKDARFPDLLEKVSSQTTLLSHIIIPSSLGKDDIAAEDT